MITQMMMKWSPNQKEVRKKIPKLKTTERVKSQALYQNTMKKVQKLNQRTKTTPHQKTKNRQKRVRTRIVTSNLMTLTVLKKSRKEKVKIKTSSKYPKLVEEKRRTSQRL